MQRRRNTPVAGGATSTAGESALCNTQPPEQQTPANDAEVRCWQVIYPGVDSVEVLFAPEATHTEVAAIYTGARIQPSPDPLRRKATAAEAEELRMLVAAILADADEAQRAEALTVALADPDAALMSFRELAAHATVATPATDRDDRRTCEECANLDRNPGRDGSQEQRWEASQLAIHAANSST